MPFKRRRELTDDLLQQVKALPEEDALKAIRELKSTKQFVKGKGGNQLTIPVQLTMTNLNRTIATKALVDSGCVGSCIDCNFVQLHKLPTKPAVIPIPVYNADSSINSDGSICEFVTI